MGYEVTKKPAQNGLAFHLRFDQIHRHLIPRATFERATCSLLLHATPLLEEKWDFGSQALIPNIHDPFLHDRSYFRGELVSWFGCIIFTLRSSKNPR